MCTVTQRARVGAEARALGPEMPTPPINFGPDPGALSCSQLPWELPSCPSSPGSNLQNCLPRKDESKEPIVEVRTEEERTPNHDGGKHTEPNETTPLTEPEYVGGEGLPLGCRAPHSPHRSPHRPAPPMPPTHLPQPNGAGQLLEPVAGNAWPHSLAREKAFLFCEEPAGALKGLRGLSGSSRPSSRVTRTPCKWPKGAPAHRVGLCALRGSAESV